MFIFQEQAISMQADFVIGPLPVNRNFPWKLFFLSTQKLQRMFFTIKLQQKAQIEGKDLGARDFKQEIPILSKHSSFWHHRRKERKIIDHERKLGSQIFQFTVTRFTNCNFKTVNFGYVINHAFALDWHLLRIMSAFNNMAFTFTRLCKRFIRCQSLVLLLKVALNIT